MGKRTLKLLLLPLLFISGCATVPYTERQQLMMVSEAEEERIGKAAFAEVKKESRLSGDVQAASLIREVGLRIAGASDKPGFRWEFLLLEDKAANAFALPGGKVAFYTGILPVCRDEAGVAVVMGHEVAHVLARHGAERLSQMQILAIGQVAIDAAMGGRDPALRGSILQAYGLGAQIGVMLPYSRAHESEADKIGLIIMAKAGYDPRAAVDFWKRMSAKDKGLDIELLSTHPSDERRIREIEGFIPIAMDYYNEAVTKNPGLKRPPRPIR